jgi:hypothetical protein
MSRAPKDLATLLAVRIAMFNPGPGRQRRLGC